jgi:hypothetical protein
MMKALQRESTAQSAPRRKAKPLVAQGEERLGCLEHPITADYNDMIYATTPERIDGGARSRSHADGGHRVRRVAAHDLDQSGRSTAAQ